MQRNRVANVADSGTAMTATVWPKEMLKVFSPDFVAPPVGFLVSPFNENVTGGLFEISFVLIAAQTFAF